MRVMRAFLMSFSMFCALPCPIKFWDPKLRPMMTALMPLVGLVIGALWSFAAFLCIYLELPRLLAAAILTLVPWALSGYIHLDGFMDSCDAILSRRSLEERIAILKDAHTGSFAVISFSAIVIISFGAFYEANWFDFLALMPVPVITRACSAIAVQRLKLLRHSQYANCERPVYATAIPASLLAAAVALSILLGGNLWIPSAAAIFGWCAACLKGCRGLGGMSGDVSGFAITVSEVCAVAIFAFI